MHSTQEDSYLQESKHAKAWGDLLKANRITPELMDFEWVDLGSIISL